MGIRIGNEKIQREEGYLYFVGKDGYVWAAPTNDNETGVKKKVGTEKIVKEKGYMYFIDKDGFLAKAKMKEASQVGVPARMIMFCQKCGKENSDDATFCNSCGANLTKKLTSTDAALINRSMRNNRDAALRKLVQSKNNKAGIIFVFGILLIVAMYTIQLPLSGSQYTIPTVVALCNNPATLLLWGSVCQNANRDFYIGWIAGILLIAWGILSIAYIKK